MKIARFCGALALLVFVLAGCNPADVADSGKTRDVLKTALSAPAVSRIFDAGTRAIDNDDLQTLSEQCDELRRLGAHREADLLSLGAAGNAVIEAAQLENKASESSTRKSELLAQAAQQYRLALRLSPDFPSQNPDLLNALGYFLADRGSSNADFVTAENLTRRALNRLDELAKSQLILSSADVAFTRANTRDSLAWALFRQKKFQEAFSQQQQAMSEARGALVSGASDPSGESLREMTFHLQQIEKAVGHKTEFVPMPTPPEKLKGSPILPLKAV